MHDKIKLRLVLKEGMEIKTFLQNIGIRIVVISSFEDDCIICSWNPSAFINEYLESKIVLYEDLIAIKEDDVFVPVRMFI